MKGNDQMEFIGTLCLILIATTLGSHLSRRIGIPAVIGQLLVGVILGQAGLNWVHPNILVHVSCGFGKRSIFTQKVF